ncbi:MAG TPA: hypothetical protein VH601_14745 [Bryobacteraceae bacterium]|jgi:hypothetical protein
MVLPLEIEFHNRRPIEDVETRIWQEVAELEKFYNRIFGCRVDVELPSHSRRASVAEVRLLFRVPTKDAATPAEFRGGAANTEGM